MYELRIVDPILAQIEKEGWLKVPSIAVYYYSYKAMTDFDNRAEVIGRN